LLLVTNGFDLVLIVWILSWQQMALVSSLGFGAGNPGFGNYDLERCKSLFVLPKFASFP
jgi:hypothetical protein